MNAEDRMNIIGNKIDEIMPSLEKIEAETKNINNYLSDIMTALCFTGPHETEDRLQYDFEECVKHLHIFKERFGAYKKYFEFAKETKKNMEVADIYLADAFK